MRNQWRSERGQVLVLAAVSMVVVIGFTALAVDGGYLYFRHTRLQDAVDAAALAAAIDLGSDNGDKVKSFEEAMDNMAENGFTVSNRNNKTFTANVSLGDETGTVAVAFVQGGKKVVNEVRVEVSLETTLFFSRVFGKSKTPVGAMAAVMIGQAAEQTGNLLPIAFFDGEYERGVQYPMSLDPQDNNKGNFCFLQFGNNSSDFQDHLEHGYDGTLEIGQLVNTYPGGVTGPVYKLIDGMKNPGPEDSRGRIYKCEMHVTCSETCTAAEHSVNCPRVVIVPVIDKQDFLGVNGKGKVPIVGFARFFIQDYRKEGSIHHIEGTFLERVDPASISGTSSFTIQAVRLIK